MQKQSEQLRNQYNGKHMAMVARTGAQMPLR